MFKIGDKVICIYKHNEFSTIDRITIGNIYTVKESFKETGGVRNGREWVAIEADDIGEEDTMLADSFILLSEYEFKNKLDRLVNE